MSWMPVRLTKMIFALIATCGVRTSSCWMRATISARRDGASVMMSLLVALSAAIEPRTTHPCPPICWPCVPPPWFMGMPRFWPVCMVVRPVQSRASSVLTVFCSAVAFA